MIKSLIFFLFLTLWSSVINAKGVFDAETLIPTTDFFEPKNIVFCAQGGGSSHLFWILEIMKELHERGHNVSLHTVGDHMVFGKDYPMINTHQLVKYDNFVIGVLKEGMLNHPAQHSMALSTLKHATTEYIRLFQETQDIIRENKVDLVISDAFTLGSADAAINMKVPLVITSTFTQYPDSDKEYVNNDIYTIRKATINDESLYTRLFNKFYVPYSVWKMKGKLKDIMKFQRKHGFEPTIDSSAKRYEKVTKLINNVFGLEISRETSQLYNMIGPILRTSYPNLDEKTKVFLSQHNRVVYVAFGQHTVPSKEDVQIVLYNLLKLKKEGHFDGIIWARLDSNSIPEKLEISTKKSKFTVSKSDILNDPDFLILAWARQYGILQHPSTVLFFSHGGVGSIHEGLYSRVPMFIYPFFAEQPMNGYMLKRLGVGDHIDTIQIQYTKKDYNTVYERLRKMLQDSDGKIAQAVDRFANSLQIRSKNSIQRGADIVEEAVFASNSQGQLEYLQDVKHEINWIKRNSIDLYAIVLCFAGLSSFVVLKAASHLLSTNKKIKAE